MKKKAPKMYQPLSRWKKIIIHDENNKITSIHILDDKEKLTDYKKKPKRKICYRETLEKKFFEYVQSKDFLHRCRKQKNIMQNSVYLDIKKKSQLDKLLGIVSKTKNCTENDDSVLNIKNDQEINESLNENLEMLMKRYFTKEDDENDQNDDILSIL